MKESILHDCILVTSCLSILLYPFQIPAETSCPVLDHLELKHRTGLRTRNAIELLHS